MANLEGQRLDGRYQIEALIGVGGMADVYRATDIRTGTTVAVKVLKEELLDNEELVRRFKNESKAISILNHPHIVKVLDVSVTDKLQYIVMEYIDGITLKEYLNQRGGPLTWKEVIHFVTQVLEALEHAHSHGVVHRDVKPQNIMLLADGTIKMMDFGIARISRAQSQTVSDKAIGSVHYISPEQAKGDTTDCKADIYSVGIMMYEMLSGQLPFEGDNAVSIAIMQISDQAKPLSQVAPNVPQALQDITEKAMSKNPSDRYASAREMLLDLENFKKNPSASFEYQYMTENSPKRYVNQVMKENAHTAAAAGAAPRAANPGVRAEAAQGAPRRTTASTSRPAAPSAAAARPKTKVNATGAVRTGAAPRRKKKKKFDFLPIFCGMTAAFAIGAMIMCYSIFSNSTNPLFSNKEDVYLGDFTNKTVDQVKADASFDSFNVVWDEQYNSHYEAGVVYSQTPKANRTVKEGQKVTLRVSLGTLWVTLPSLSNMVQADAEDALKELGMSVQTFYQESDTVTVGTVISTNPTAGTQVASGETVIMYVSRAKVDTTRTVPQVIGLTKEDARVALVNNSLTVSVNEVSSSEPAGTVISQSPGAGSTVKMGQRVSIQVSTGVAEVVVPVDGSGAPEMYAPGTAEAEQRKQYLISQGEWNPNTPGYY